jgi:hypothetical protein
LTHKKLNKLVYVNYNLRLRLKEVSTPSRDEGDFIDHLAHLSFYDEHHPVREWFEYARFNQEPVLDEDEDDGDVPLPSHLVSDHVYPSDLRETTSDDCISDWARRVVGDTHLVKRKFQKGPTKGDPKRQRGQVQTKGKAKQQQFQWTATPPLMMAMVSVVHRIRTQGIAARLMMVMVMIVMVTVVVVMVLVLVVVVVFVSQVYIAT